MTFQDGGRLGILSAVLMILVGQACLGWQETRERRWQDADLSDQVMSIVTATINGVAADDAARRAATLASAVPVLAAQGARRIALAGVPAGDEPAEEAGPSAKRGGDVFAVWPSRGPVPDRDVLAILAVGVAFGLLVFSLLRRSTARAHPSALALAIVALPLAVAQVGLIIVDGNRAETANQQRLAVLEWGVTEAFQAEQQQVRERDAAVVLARSLAAFPSIVALDLRSPTGASIARSHRPIRALEAAAAPHHRALVAGVDMPLHAGDLTVTFVRSLDPGRRIGMVLSASGMALVFGMIAFGVATAASSAPSPVFPRWGSRLAACGAIVLPAAATGLCAGVAGSLSGGGYAAALALAGVAAGVTLGGRLLVGRPWRGVTIALALPAVATAAVAAAWGQPGQAVVLAAYAVALGAVLSGMQARILSGRRIAGRLPSLGRIWGLAAAGLAGGLIMGGATVALRSAPWTALLMAATGLVVLAAIPPERAGPLRHLVRAVRAPSPQTRSRTRPWIGMAAASVLGSAAALAGGGPAEIVPALLFGVMLQPALAGKRSRPACGEIIAWLVVAPVIVLVVAATSLPVVLIKPSAGLIVGIGLGRLVRAVAPEALASLRASPLDLAGRSGAAAGAVCGLAAVVAAALGAAGGALP